MLTIPSKLKRNDFIGIFTPSWPGNVILNEKYLHALSNLEALGFKIIEGKLTKSLTSQGYRSGTPIERAEEFNELYKNEKIKCLMSTIGGSCTSSILPYIDYEYIKNNPKIVCGYSDITALHLALNKKSLLSTFYGPALIPTFGEYPNLIDYSLESWLIQTGIKKFDSPLRIFPPRKFSNDLIDATKSNWKNRKRTFKENQGWKIVNCGYVKAPVRVYNLSTLSSLAGTFVWPDLKNRILILEQMNCSYGLEERYLNQLKLIGVFDEICGLIISKPEYIYSENSTFTFQELLIEIVGSKRKYPIIMDFDCGHTTPMLTIPQDAIFEIDTRNDECIILQH